jgi:hypothetical protein
MDKLLFLATADHSGGESVGHPCRRGVFSDPTDSWQAEIEGESIAECEALALADFARAVGDPEPCGCERELCAGSHSWWGSVTVKLSPRNIPALHHMLADGALGEHVADDIFAADHVRAAARRHAEMFAE